MVAAAAAVAAVVVLKVVVSGRWCIVRGVVLIA